MQLIHAGGAGATPEQKSTWDKDDQREPPLEHPPPPPRGGGGRFQEGSKKGKLAKLGSKFAASWTAKSKHRQWLESLLQAAGGRQMRSHSCCAWVSCGSASPHSDPSEMSDPGAVSVSLI